MVDVAISFLLLGLLMLGGWLVRRTVRPLRKLFIPSSIIAGLIGLALGPQLLGRLADADDPDVFLAQGLWTQPVLDVWSELPKLLISVVFAGLFVGKTIPGIRSIWKRAGPMVAHGQTMAWGQYVVGLTLVVLLLTPVWSIDPMAGALIEIGFEGGHGTAAGLAGTFEELGFESGADLALGLATIGVVAGVLLGTLMINWAVWRGHIPRPDSEEQMGEEPEPEPLDESEDAPKFKDRSTDPLSFHIALLAVSIAIGWLILEAIKWGERTLLVPMGWPELATHLPLFPLAMIGGVIVQVIAMRTGLDRSIDRRLVNRISGASLDMLIVSALATLSLAALGEHFWPFLILAVAGIAWNIFGFVVLARRMFVTDWVPKGLANFGQGIGMTVVGLLLIRMSDPQQKSDAMEAFGYKQLLFEPVVGGGLFTAASLPLIVQFGPVPVLVGTGVLMVGWLIFGLWLARKMRRDAEQGQA